MGGSAERIALTAVAVSELIGRLHAAKTDCLGEEMMARALLIGLAFLAASAWAATAGDVKGEWAREDGKAKVRFAACGAEAVCGSIIWVKDPSGPGKIGQEVFFDMKPDGDNAWAGTAFNPEDGKRYAGKMTLSGDRLVTAGCVFGGLLCKSFNWTRAR
jgi:uncharacterized protein (DUF2147 family)